METPRCTAILPGAFRLFGAFSAVFALALLPAACSDSDGSPTGGGSLSSGSGDSGPALSSGDGGSSPSGSDAGGRSRPGEGGSSGSVPGGTSSGTLSSGEETTSSSGPANWREACLQIVNEYRATENLAPLALASGEKQLCADSQSGDDLASGQAHSHFGDCGESAQNTGPNVHMTFDRTYADYAQLYLKMMWEDEKALVTSGQRDPEKDEDYPYIGHYLNMKGNYRTLACGFAVSSDGRTGWFNVDFFR
ncbi:MAG: hypothetical protein J6Y56_07450 [Fibrobacterales bacterium]|nr:hypothetical protein [Fibrobacterales bacterium]